MSVAAGGELTANACLGLSPADRTADAIELARQLELVTGLDDPLETAVVDAGEVGDLASVLVLSQHGDRAGLRHRLDDQHARHHRAAREVAGEVPLVSANASPSDHPLSSLELHHFVDEKEGLAMREDRLDLGASKRGLHAGESTECRADSPARRPPSPCHNCPMRRARLLFGLLAAVGFLLFISSVSAQAEPKVLAVHFALDINPVSQDYVNHQIDEANEGGYSAVVILLDTPGGLSTSMEKIYERILASRVPVIVYVSPPGRRRRIGRRIRRRGGRRAGDGASDEHRLLDADQPERRKPRQRPAPEDNQPLRRKAHGPLRRRTAGTATGPPAPCAQRRT